MSKRRVYSETTQATINRFFEALAFCLETKRFKNISTYCDSHGLDKRHFYTQMKDHGRGYFETSWLNTLIEVGVSAHWLLTGEGEMCS